MFISQVEKIFFAEHLSLMIKGGIPINEALTTLRDVSKSSGFKKTISDVVEGILRGESLSSNLERHPKVFSKFFCAVVKTGEESGTLEENLMYAADQTRSFYEMKKKAKGALVYPILVMSMGIVIAFAVSFFILPKITSAFRFLEVKPLLTTRILIASSSFLQKYWWMLLIGVILLIVAFRALRKLKAVGTFFDKAVLSLPFIASIFRSLNLARASKAFYTLSKSGMPILETIDTVAETLPNQAYKKALHLICPDIEEGKKMSQGLKNFPKLFPATFVEMVAVGERSGALEESFSYLADFYKKEVDSNLRNLSEIIEPVLLILVGIFVAFIAIAIILPIYHFLGEFRPYPPTP